MGRHIYAVGGNEEAARLSGVPVGFVIVFVYIISSLTAGLGGCIQASQHYYEDSVDNNSRVKEQW